MNATADDYQPISQSTNSVTGCAKTSIPSAIGLTAVSTIGAGPFEKAEFDEFLRRLSILPKKITSHTTKLVVGRRDWTESSLRTLIESRSGKKLRVYSHEMLIAFLVTGNDPLTSPRDVIERWGKGHPALVFLSEVVGFDWPTTEVQRIGGTKIQNDWVRCGYLGYLGYKVGHNEDCAWFRQVVLTKAYQTRRLPKVFTTKYRSEWGGPSSSARLHKIARSIAKLCCNGKRRRLHDMDIAVSHWEEDLEWLRVKYYDGRYQFEWPSTEVW